MICVCPVRSPASCALEAAPTAAFCYGRCLIADARRQLPTGEIYPEHCPEGDIFWELLKNNFVPLVSVVARKQSLVALGLFNPELRLVGDWDMWLRLTERYSVVAVHEPVAIHRRANAASGQMSSDSVAMYRQMIQVQQMALQLPRARSAPRWQRRRVRRSMLNLACQAMIHEATNAMLRGRRPICPRQTSRGVQASSFPHHGEWSGGVVAAMS